MRVRLLIILALAAGCAGPNPAADWWAEARPLVNEYLRLLETVGEMTPEQVGGTVEAMSRQQAAFDALPLPVQAQSAATLLQEAMRHDNGCLAGYAADGNGLIAAACLVDASRWQAAAAALQRLGVAVEPLNLETRLGQE